MLLLAKMASFPGKERKKGVGHQILALNRTRSSGRVAVERCFGRGCCIQFPTITNGHMRGGLKQSPRD